MTTRYHLLTSAESQIAIARSSVCIAIIDESSNGPAPLFTSWAEFRALFPLRPYSLIQVAGPAAGTLNVPTNMQSSIINEPFTRAFISNPIANFTAYDDTIDAAVFPNGMTRDNGNVALRSDLFAICGLSTLQPGNNVFLYVDASGSMTPANVRATLNLLQTNCNAAGIIITSVAGDISENYIEPFVSFNGTVGVP